ncbi:uncharacterized protein LOC105840772 [Monomorium pharaonis]|uniref:uncharacterized protein LOC105840772 n=1 Tax=Monomorium pharaonis TaxID=307658 RepID=UPI0017460EBB|nr:uncharacterized protein LOC105840772 [Monomorium pharaonis]
MTDLLSKQVLLQRSIERALDNFKKVGRANLTPAKIRSRLASLQDNWGQFQEGHVRLLQAVPERDQAAMDYFKDGCFEATEDVYQNTKDVLTDCLEALEPVVSPNPSLHSTCVHADASGLASSRMPPIRLPPFSGSYSDWENFRDRFSALVIQNNSLSDFARMHYLASSVSGPALNCISDIKITADNFQVAWAALTNRFDNKQRLMKNHFTTLFGLSTLQRESGAELQALVDKVQITVSSLRLLDRTPSDLWNDFLVHLVIQRLDPVTRKACNLKWSEADDPPTYEELNRFLTGRCRALDDNAISSNSKSNRASNVSRAHVATTSDSAQRLNASAPACPLCKARHYLSACPKFVALTPKLRMETVKKFKRCLNCMSAAHLLPDCTSQYSCRSCQKRHHSLLHMELASPLSSSANENAGGESSAISEQINSLVASTTTCARDQVLLATARVTVGVSSGNSVVVRALIDQGSEATFISETLAQTLRAKRTRMPVAVSAVGGVQIGQVRQALTITVSPSRRVTPSFATTALILKSLTLYAPKRVSSRSALSHLSHLSWADPDPTSSETINIIIGADLYGDIILDGIQKGASGQPIAQNTVFGWVVSGPVVATASAIHIPVHFNVHHCASSLNLETALQVLGD